MDEYVENILKKWNLADLVHRFREEEVNEEAFLLLTPDIIKELIPKLGKRAIFTARFNELKQPPQVHNEPIVQDTIDLLITQDNTKQTTHFIEQGPSVSSEFQSVSHITGSTNDCDSPTAKRVGVSSEPTKTHLDEQRPSTSEFVSLSHAPASTSDGETPCAKRIKLESDVFDEFSDSILLEDSSQDSTALLEDENENMDKTLKDPKVPGVEKLRLLLQQSPFARYLLGLNELDRFHRIDITNFVTQYIYNSNPNERIKHAEFKYWAEAIVNLFPSENQLITSDAAIEFYTARLTTRYNYMMKIKKDAKGPVFESASPSRRGKNVGRKESKDEAELQVVEELRRIVGSCFVMRDTLNSRSLTPYQRNVLAAYIVNYLMDKNGGPISIRELELYARAIEQVFPNENASIYFRRKGNCANVNGKLYDRYGYMKRKRSMAQGKPYSDFLDGSTPIGRLREIKTVEEARALWNETHNARKEVTRKVVPIKLFEQYPFLTQPDGYTLFTDDFDQDHPNSIDTFKRYWPDFASAIYRYIEENRVLKGVTEFNTEDSSKPADNFTIVEIMDGAEAFLYSLPSKWVHKNGWNHVGPDIYSKSSEGTDLSFWPNTPAGYRLLERSKEDPNATLVRDCLAPCRCKIKKSNFTTYEEACLEQQMMEMDNSVEKHDLHQQEHQHKLKSFEVANMSNENDTEKLNLLQAIDVISRKESASAQVSLTSSLESTVNALQAKVSQISAEFDAFKALVKAELAASFQKRTHSEPERVATQAPQQTITMPPAPSIASSIIPTVQNPTIPIVPVLPVNRNTTEGQQAVPPLVPVKNLEDLEALQERARDERFVESVVHSLGIVHGQGRSVGNGWTVSLQTVDYFFDRAFLLRCSWTGSGRNKEKDGARISKIAFHKYDKVIGLFYRVIVYSDPMFTFNDCMKFLHRCIRNAKARAAESKRMRLSVARNRKKRSDGIDGFGQMLQMDTSHLEQPEEYYYQVEPLVKDEYVEDNASRFDDL
ncbi:uncharacterized protein LOC134209873 isoform X1 [Armigeres subalbatus]|uniref:uncharacterized protein LOC134209873 isoform X1 n=1 Tax=Armigeres subalbatus TaxID=124917 RepID=UPI002ED14AE3